MTVSAAALRVIARPRGAPGAHWLALLGPAFAVSIGYIDPGNWATDLGAGAYGYRLLWVVGVANVIAIVLQLAVSKLTLASGEDLATGIARRWPRLATPLWTVFQGAAIATDLAEFSGIVLGVQLVFHFSLIASVLAGLAIVAALLALTDRTAKGFEYVLLGAVGTIAIALLTQIPRLHVAWGAVAAGAVVPQIPGGGALVLVVGIVGATVMPHNLFLHSALVRKSLSGCDAAERRRRGRFFTRETLVALNVAAVVNAALLIAGATLHGAGGSFARAFALLRIAGGATALIFGGALLLSGIAASMTATVSGDYIFAGMAPLRLSPLLRRGVTIVPAALVIGAGAPIAALLIWSQVALALTLPAVLVPLVALMLERRGARRACGTRSVSCTAAASLLCVGFDAVMIVQLLHG